MKNVNILCLPYGKLSELVYRASMQIKDENIQITLLEGLSEVIVDEIEQAIYDGADVIVAGGSNADFVEKHFDIPVVHIRISSYDYIKAVNQAKQLGDKIAVFVMEGPQIHDFKNIGKLMGVPINVITYCTGDNLQSAIASCGANVVIGASHTAEVAEKLGIPSVLIYPGEEAVVDAFLEANKLINTMRRDQTRRELTDALIRCTPNSIVIIDDQCRITAFNSEAEKAYHKKAISVMGQPVSEVLKECNLNELLNSQIDKESEIYTIGDKMYLQKQIRITYADQVTGAIEILAELTDIRHAEYRYNVEQSKKNQHKRFYAKTHFADIVGFSKSLEETINEAKLFSKTDSSILIFGETGTGKELFAQSIHNFSDRKNGPFVAINCAALPENLLESELFGYEEGAFTGSKKGGKMGIFELANGGTIFLDEIGEIGLPLQARLLRVIQEKEVMRLGGDRIYKFDARVISATNKDIAHMDDKQFRKDLLYRLKVFELKIPPLRERDDDVIEIFLFFLKHHINLYDYEVEIFKPVFSLLKNYTWPGNVRELQNVCERFCLYLKQTLHPSQRLLKRYIVRAIGEEVFVEDVLRQNNYSPELYKNNEKLFSELIATLKQCFDYNNEQIASVLGVSRTTLWRLGKNHLNS